MSWWIWGRNNKKQNQNNSREAEQIFCTFAANLSCDIKNIPIHLYFFSLSFSLFNTTTILGLCTKSGNPTSAANCFTFMWFFFFGNTGRKNNLNLKHRLLVFCSCKPCDRPTFAFCVLKLIPMAVWLFSAYSGYLPQGDLWFYIAAACAFRNVLHWK